MSPETVLALRHINKLLDAFDAITAKRIVELENEKDKADTMNCWKVMEWEAEKLESRVMKVREAFADVTRACNEVEGTDHE